MSNTQEPENDIIGAKEASKMLGVSMSYFYVMVQDKKILPIPLPGPTILKQPKRKYRRSDIAAFLLIAA